jgi:prolyl-tRNA synthetase
MSERILGALIGIHGDNKGLIMPPAVAPTQIVIIPIIFKGKEKIVTDACKLLEKQLKIEGYRVRIDNRDITPGNKYYEWELKGVPIRIEIGPRDIENKQIVLVRRDTSDKKSIQLSSSVDSIKKELENIDKNLFDNAKKILNENVHRIESIDKAKNLKGIVELPWCGNKDCALEIENVLEGNTLGEPIEDNKCNKICPVCKKPGITWMRYAKSY